MSFLLNLHPHHPQPCASVGCRRCASALPEGLFPRCQWHWLWLLLPPWEISFLYDFICFFSAVLGLCGRVGFSLAAASRGRSLVGAHGLLFEAEHRLQGMRASVVAARGLSIFLDCAFSTWQLLMRFYISSTYHWVFSALLLNLLTDHILSFYRWQKANSLAWGVWTHTF